ncbi:hypothetical protein FGU71_11920 [Erythrobacter insulae]|uniref:Uncharacterized protein n=1 Tax=Erythrobacter insulae TaxID=2584124 RepID=A0A547PEF1_9SPHN|nr:hypothetical protein [Erythrobacter insulae]TRD12499.1 hypothetical protein FGU71_11920 [Erythrobacter insulae]
MGDGAYNKLQHELCVGMGFCGGLADGKPSHVDDFIPEGGVVTVDQFIQLLFQAEGDGYPANYDAKQSPQYEELKRIFVEQMGAVSVNASRLKWDV